MVAIEFGYCWQHIKTACHDYSFKTAADLIDYLTLQAMETNNDSCICPEEKKQEAKVEEEKGKEVTREALQKETNNLLVTRLCLVCREAERNIVCLPCSHLSLCHRCSPKTLRCPYSMCDSLISHQILTFLV